MPDQADFLRLQGKSVVVTGATSGIGRAFAVRAAQHGARLALVARRESVLHEVRSELVGSGHLVIAADLAQHDGTGAVLRRAAQEMDGLDGLVHAAGVHSTTPLRSLTAAQVAALFDTNVTSAVMLAQAFRHKQVRKPGASIVLLSSAVGLVGQPGVSAYSATKGAIASLARSLALEFVRDGVRVNSVAPGVVETPLAESIRHTIGDAAYAAIAQAHPLGLGTADDVADAILYLLSPASSWVTGTTLVVDGGYTAQ